MSARIAVAVETGQKKVFATAVDWPGWSRSGKTEQAALEALAASGARYARVAQAAREVFPTTVGLADFEIVERHPGGSGTDFGVPGLVTEHDRRPVTRAEADRLRRLVAAAWATFEAVVAQAPAELRKGPRGGGRDRDRIVEHVVGSDHGYAHEMGLNLAAPAPSDTDAVKAMLSLMLDPLGQPSDGSPLAGRRWPPRYAAGRVAWHALDHAWEIEDRSASD
jgi:hypothetical protein